MTTLLFIGTHGPDDSTRATLPFHFANGALEAGFNTKVLLVGDAAFLMKESIAREVKGVAVPALSDIMAKVVAAGGEVHV
ncbi:MAG: DsrE family protein [Tepidiformaceae bacterium]